MKDLMFFNSHFAVASFSKKRNIDTVQATVLPFLNHLSNTTNLKKFKKKYPKRLVTLNKLYIGTSSHWRCSIKKGAVKNFANFTGPHLC